MAYEPKVWQCGDTITADDLNHMEEGIANCGGGSAGFECTESWQTLTEESVTTAKGTGEVSSPYARGILSYAGPITVDTIRVTFDGTVYEAEKKSLMGMEYYGADPDPTTGAVDFSEFPFSIIAYGGANGLFTENEGTYTVKIEAFETTVETTPCFDKAVAKANGLLMVKFDHADDDELYFDKTFDQAVDAFMSGKTIICEDGEYTPDEQTGLETWNVKGYKKCTAIHTVAPIGVSFSELFFYVSNGGTLYLLDTNDTDPHRSSE